MKITIQNTIKYYNINGMRTTAVKRAAGTTNVKFCIQIISSIDFDKHNLQLFRCWNPVDSVVAYFSLLNIKALNLEKAT